jgi:CRP/FNR family transcriptional regulator, cyclic AMP receptor protein
VAHLKACGGKEGAMARGTARTAELTEQDLVAAFRDEPNVVRLEPGEVLFKNGDPSACMYVVRSGTLTIRSGSVIYENVGPGGIVGEMGIVETHMARSAMVYARSPAELVEIDEQRFLSLVEETPSFALAVMRVLSRRLRTMDVRYDANRGDPDEPEDRP